ncbi:MAG: hypothetical protein HYX75_24260 [Acidobacteria bacterium]|nr:hypothetical protein [Acidobacteriota bacterium]
MRGRRYGIAVLSRPSGTGRSLVHIDPGLAPWAFFAAPLWGAQGRSVTAILVVRLGRLVWKPTSIRVTGWGAEKP